MRSGYLTVETRSGRPGLVRIHTCAVRPPSEKLTAADPRVCYMARFQDTEAALMHAHNALRRSLVDVDARLYRADPIDAIALSHERLHLDPDLANSPSLARKIAQRRARQARIDRLWERVGVAALVLLAVLLLLGP